jgi:hypothetical protein
MDGRSVSSSNTTASFQRRERRPWNIQKLLAQDIEIHGGIKHFTSVDGKNGDQRFSKLLNKRDPIHPSDPPNPYGTRGDSIRKKLRKKLEHWIYLHKEGRYITEILNPWLIEKYPSSSMGGQNRTPARNTRSAPRVSEDIFVDSSVSGDSNIVGQFKSPPGQVVVATKKGKYTPMLPMMDQFSNMNVLDKKHNKSGTTQWDPTRVGK